MQDLRQRAAFPITIATSLLCSLSHQPLLLFQKANVGLGGNRPTAFWPGWMVARREAQRMEDRPLEELRAWPALSEGLRNLFLGCLSDITPVPNVRRKKGPEVMFQSQTCMGAT